MLQCTFTISWPSRPNVHVYASMYVYHALIFPESKDSDIRKKLNNIIIIIWAVTLIAIEERIASSAIFSRCADCVNKTIQIFCLMFYEKGINTYHAAGVSRQQLQNFKIFKKCQHFEISWLLLFNNKHE